MVKFESWKDAYLFMREYGNFTCLNCKFGGTHNLDTESEHSDSYYAQLFCTEWVAMVRLDFQFVCEKWKHQDSGETLEGNLDCDTWNIPSSVAEEIDKDGKKWTFEEIEVLVNEELAKQESN